VRRDRLNRNSGILRVSGTGELANSEPAPRMPGFAELPQREEIQQSLILAASVKFEVKENGPARLGRQTGPATLRNEAFQTVVKESLHSQGTDRVALRGKLPTSGQTQSLICQCIGKHDSWGSGVAPGP
jgi:hypothetical protein